MAVNPYSEARARANKAYDEKTYKTYRFLLRMDDDADIIEALEDCQARGLKSRESLRELYEESAITIPQVREALEKHGISEELAGKILADIK